MPAKLHPKLFLSILICLLLSSPPAQHDAVTAQGLYDHFQYLTLIPNGDPQITFYPSGDAEIREDVPGANFSTELELEVGSGGYSPDACRSLIRFDLSSLPSSAQILEANLSVYYHSWVDNYQAVRILTFHRVTSPWQASEVTWYSQPSASEAFGSLVLPADMNHWGYHEIDITLLTQEWQSFPSENYGILIRSGESRGEHFYRSFWSREGEHPPKIVIVYR